MRVSSCCQYPTFSHHLCFLLVVSLLTFRVGFLQADNKHEGGFKEIDWVDLLPDEDLQALMNPPSWMTEIVDGSDADDLALLSSDRPFDQPLSESDERFRQALNSSAIRPEFDNQAVRIPGFIVPLAFDDRRRTIEFFLVPYFGACLHLPPPPPNQIIYVNYEPGLELDLLYEPYWIEGVLRADSVANPVADAAYRITAANIEVWRE
jgi:uncharacterized protein